MLNEILKIVLSRNINNKKLNKDDIRRICYIIIKKMKYEKMVRRILFEKRNQKFDDVASFDGEDLIFYIDSNIELANKNYQDLLNKNMVIKGGLISYYNFEILNTIFHEFAHIRQDYLICRRVNNKEAEIYNICYKIVEKIKGFYQDNYEILLTEINAFNDGMLKSFNIYKNAPLDAVCKNDKEIYAKLLLNEILSNYYANNNQIFSSSEILIETLKYYNYDECREQIDRLESIVYQNNFSLYDRVKLGLPITLKEYQYLNIIYDNIKTNYNFVKKIRK